MRAAAPMGWGRLALSGVGWQGGVLTVHEHHPAARLRFSGTQQVTALSAPPPALCRVVGWYHSHPTFPTQPSTIDLYNQARWWPWLLLASFPH